MAAWDKDLDQAPRMAWDKDLDTPDPAVRANALLPAAPPEAAASAVRLSRQTGLPFDLVARNHEQVQRRAAADTIEANTSQTATLRARYTDPAFASLAGDDSANLAALESTVTGYTFGNALKKGIAGAKLTLDFAANQLAKAVGADTTETQRILGETGAFYRAQGSDPQLQAAGERAKAAGGGTWYGTLLNLPREVAAEDNPFQILGKFMTEQLPASMLGFGIGAAATAPVTHSLRSCMLPSSYWALPPVNSISAAFTPETPDTTHYFWATARDYKLGDAEFTAAMRGALEFAFEQEDMPIIRDSHRLMRGADFWDLRPLILGGDGGGVRARRMLQRLIDREREATAA